MCIFGIPLKSLEQKADISFVLESLKLIIYHSLLYFKFLSVWEFSFSFKWFLCLHNVISYAYFILQSLKSIHTEYSSFQVFLSCTFLL